MLIRLLSLLVLPLAALIGIAAPASADDISATGRGVVRVVTIAVVDDQVVGFGHGSGFAVAPNRIVTNAHVVELAERYPDNVVVGVVPTEGDKSYQGKVIAYDVQRDLALIEFTGARLPQTALYTGPIAGLSRQRRPCHRALGRGLYPPDQPGAVGGRVLGPAQSERC